MLEFIEEKQTIKLKDGKFLYPVETWAKGGRRFFRFGFNLNLKNAIKQFEGARWSPEEKVWHVADVRRNHFQLRYLANEPVYKPYDTKLDFMGIPTERYNHRAGKLLPLFSHQREGVAHIFQRHHCGIAGEMGTGKTLAALVAAELAIQTKLAEGWKGVDDVWYVAPKSALMSVQRDFGIWGAKITPNWMTYEGLVKEMKNWQPGRKAPFMIVFDEFSRCKNATAQRTQCAKAIADGVRDDWGSHGYIIGLTGTPAPKSPADWYSQSEILCPGFLREGDLNKFKRRLAIIVMKEGLDGAGSYPQLLAWRDNEKRCDKCGEFQEHENHVIELEGALPYVHPYVPSKNEVAILGERLKGLFIVHLKKNCLDLPDKHYRVIECPPTKSTLRAANLIVRSSKTVIEGLTRLRELSDGFQYVEVKTGQVTCVLCKGAKEIEQPVEVEDTCPNCGKDSVVADSKFDVGNCGNHLPQYVKEIRPCPNCNGTGLTDTFDRHTDVVACPKDDKFDECLEEYEDIGRIVVYGGFSGTIDRVVGLCHRRGWYVIRMDQGAIRITDPDGVKVEETDFQSLFQDKLVACDKVAFVAHPKSGGMGLTLTASPVIIYYSNDFDGEARIQSEDRIHRPGMDVNRGATIIDLVHLPSDQKVLDNLQKKRDLQSMTLGDFAAGLGSEEARPE